jgi:hypothetical protein
MTCWAIARFLSNVSEETPVPVTKRKPSTVNAFLAPAINLLRTSGSVESRSRRSSSSRSAHSTECQLREILYYGERLTVLLGQRWRLPFRQRRPRGGILLELGDGVDRWIVDRYRCHCDLTIPTPSSRHLQDISPCFSKESTPILVGYTLVEGR